MTRCPSGQLGELAIRQKIEELAAEIRRLTWGGIRPETSAEWNRLASRKWALEEELRRRAQERVQSEEVSHA